MGKLILQKKGRIWGNIKCEESIRGMDELNRLDPKCYSEVKSLILSNQLVKFPPKISKFTQLKKLYFTSKLTKFPKEIGNLTQLETLYLGYNKLTTLPKEIGNLSRLQKLNLSNNKLVLLPKEIGKLTKLRELDLGDNDIVELPQEISTLKELRGLYISNNHITKMPDGTYFNLKQFYLQHNPIHILPQQMCKTLFDGRVETDFNYVKLCNDTTEAR